MHLVEEKTATGLRRAADLLFGSTFTLSRCQAELLTASHSNIESYNALQVVSKAKKLLSWPSE